MEAEDKEEGRWERWKKYVKAKIEEGRLRWNGHGSRWNGPNQASDHEASTSTSTEKKEDGSDESTTKGEPESGEYPEVAGETRDRVARTFSGLYEKYGETRLRSSVHQDVYDAVQLLDGEDSVNLMKRRLKWGITLQKFRKYGNCSTGNKITLMDDGDEAYTAMLETIRHAKHRVWCETYIIDKGTVAKLFLEELTAAAKRGVEVIFLVDWLGGFSVDSELVDGLRQAGGEVVFFNPPSPLSASIGPMSFRDHRKILICDDVGFLGSMNLADDHASTQYGCSGNFYDLQSKVEGPCVYDLAGVFLDSMRESGARVKLDLGAVPEPKGDLYVQVLESNVRARKTHIQKVVRKTMDAAQSEIHLASSYFIPPSFVRRALKRAAVNGVNLNLLLSGSSDFYPIPGDLMAQHYVVDQLISFFKRNQEKVYAKPASWEVYLYEKQHLHSKFLTVDGCFSMFGSFNYDRYSARRNLEVCISVFNPTFAKEMQDIHRRKCEESIKFDPVWSSYATKIICGLAYHIIRMSGKNFFDGLNVFNRKWLVRKAQLTAQLEEGAAETICTGLMWGLY